MAINSPIDLQLPEVPAGVPDDFVPILQGIYNALRNLQVALGDTTGQSYITNISYFDSLALPFKSSIQGQNPQLIYLPANVNIGIGQIVGFVNSGGILKASPAFAGVAGQVRAIGWALESVIAGASGAIALLSGYYGNSSGLTPAQTYWLSDITPGGIATTPPVGAGKISQEVAVGLSASELLIHIGPGITL